MIRSIFVWLFANIPGRALPDKVAFLRDLGVNHVMIKIADGAAPDGGSGPVADQVDFVNQCRRVGIDVWGWQYIYNGKRFVRIGSARVPANNNYSTPEREAAVALDQIRRTGVSGFVIDAEAEAKIAGAGAAARYMGPLLDGLRSSFPLGLSSYRFPSLHRELSWATYLQGVDYHVPQVYNGPGKVQTADGLVWSSVAELRRSVRELRSLKDIPILPALRLYIGDGHPNPTAEEVVAALDEVVRLGLPGCTAWAADFLRDNYFAKVGGAAIPTGKNLRTAFAAWNAAQVAAQVPPVPADPPAPAEGDPVPQTDRIAALEKTVQAIADRLKTVEDRLG